MSDVLKEAFDKVCDPDDWKDTVVGFIKPEEFDVVNEAVIFYTGTTLEQLPNDQVTEFFDSPDRVPDGMILVYADGYRMGPCGDH